MELVKGTDTLAWAKGTPPGKKNVFFRALPKSLRYDIASENIAVDEVTTT